MCVSLLFSVSPGTATAAGMFCMHNPSRAPLPRANRNWTRPDIRAEVISVDVAEGAALSHCILGIFLAEQVKAIALLNDLTH